MSNSDNLIQPTLMKQIDKMMVSNEKLLRPSTLKIAYDYNRHFDNLTQSKCMKQIDKMMIDYQKLLRPSTLKIADDFKRLQRMIH